MTSIVAWALSYRLLVVGLAAAVLVIGVTQLRSAPVDALPEYSPPYVEVQTEALGLSAAEVEQFVTVPMEALMLSGVAWVESIRSESVPGLSSIVLAFEPGTDLMRARQMVQERLTQAHALPNVAKPPQMIQPLSSASRVAIISLSSPSMSLTDLSVLARWTVRPRLMGVSGVANVSIWGHRERQLQVLVDPARLDRRDVSLDSIVRTTGNALWVSPLSYLQASTPGAGGFIETPNQRFGIRHVLPIRTPEDLARVPIEGRPGVRIGDVTDVVEDHQPMIGDAGTADGQALLLIVEKLPGEHTLDVARGVESALSAMAPGLGDVQVDPTIYRPATFVETAMTDLAMTVGLALLLIALVIAAFLLHWRSVVITMVALSVSLVSAALVLHLLGATMNAIVVAGLVVALVIVLDDAVGDVENELRRLRERDGRTDGPSTRAVLAVSVAEIRTPAMYATVVTLLLLIPVVVLDGLLGAFLQPFALAVVLAAVASMVVGLTVTPALAYLLLRAERPGADEPRLLRSIGSRYHAALSEVIRRPAPMLIVAGVVAVAGIATVPQLSTALTPTFRERDLLIDMAGTPGTSQPAMNRIAAQVSAELRAIPGVRSVGSHIGRAILSDQVVNVNSGQLWVSLEPDAEYDATMASVRAVVAGYPGLSLAVDTYLTTLAGEVAGAPPDPISVRVFGPDLAQLEVQAAAVRSAMAAVDGVVGARVATTPVEPTIVVEVDLDKAFQAGVKPGDVRRAAATLISGLEVGNLFEDQKVFEVIVVGVPDIRHSLESVRSLGIDTPDGRQVPLDSLADVRIAPAPVAIHRDAISRYVDVVATVEGRDVGAVQADVERAMAGLVFPLEYHAEPSTAYAEGQADVQRTVAIAIAVAIGILLVLQAAFRSWRLAAVSMIALPLALVGGIFAAFLAGAPLGLGSLMGFLAVLAIAARNEIALVARLQLLERHGMAFGPTLVLRAARERVGPILITATAVALAFVPIFVMGSAPGLELLWPMAVVIIGGLVSSTLLTLFIVPTLFLDMRASPEQEGLELSMPPASDPQSAGVQ